MNKNANVINDLTRGPLTRQILFFSLPLVLSNLLHTLYNLVDMAVVGQFVGSVGLSAVSTSGQITILFYALGIGLGSGGQILVAQQVGRKDYDGVGKTVGTSFTFNIILGLAVMTLGLIFNRLLLRLLNTPSEALQDAYEYMLWCCFGIPFTYINGGMSAVLRGMGDSKHPTWFVAGAALTNVVLDLLLVAVFGMRAKGAAIATSVAQAVGAVCCTVYLYRKREQTGFDFKPKSFLMDKKTLGVIIKLAAPLAFQTMAINISMLFVNAWVNTYGVAASAVNGIGSKLYSLVTIITSSLQTAVGTFTGQNLAAGREKRVHKTVRVSICLCMAFWTAAGICCALFPKAIFRIFTQDADVLALAPLFMGIQIVMYLSFATMSTPIGFINGIGNVGLNLAIAVADGVVARIGLSLLFGRVLGMGLPGYWLGNALAGFVSTILGWWYYISDRWKSRRLLVD